MRTNCVLSSDIDTFCRQAYAANFGELPQGDIRAIPSEKIPKHDVLLAGFPCQPFSIIGEGKGFEDSVNGTLFFEIVRILREKTPAMLVLENVKRLVGHEGGRTMRIIRQNLENLGYNVDVRVLNALDYGLPQKRERVFIVGFRKKRVPFSWPIALESRKSLVEVLEPDDRVPERYWASDYIRKKRHQAHKSDFHPSIWHENKAGNIGSHPYSCALRANASHNYLLVNGDRRLLPREMLRLQGYPDSFRIVCTDRQTRNQAGNSLPVPVARAVIRASLTACFPGRVRGSVTQPAGGEGLAGSWLQEAEHRAKELETGIEGGKAGGRRAN